MATISECRDAFDRLAELLAGVDGEQRKKAVLDRTVSAKIRDLDVVFSGALRDGGLHDVHQTPTSDGQIKLSLSSDDLIRLTSGELNFASAWATGRVKVDASVFDLIKLRSLF